MIENSSVESEKVDVALQYKKSYSEKIYAFKS